MLKYANMQPSRRRGSKVNDLWTAKSGHAEKPGRGSVPLNPVCRKTLTKHGHQERTCGCKASTEVGNVGPLGHVCRRKKREEKLTKRRKTCWLQSQNGVDCGGPLGAGTIKQEEKRSSGNGRWAGEPERDRWDLKDSQQEADGQYRAT